MSRPPTGRSLQIWLGETATLTLRHGGVNAGCDASLVREAPHTVGTPVRDPVSRAGVDFVLRGLEPPGEQQLGGVGGLGDEEGQLLALGAGEVLEHEVRRVLPARWTADADPDPQVVLGAGRARDRPQAVVATLAAAALEPDAGEREIELVVDDDEVGGGEMGVVEQAADRAAGLVHVGRRTGQHDPPAGEPALAGERAGAGALAGGELDAGPGGQLLEHHDADVVPVARVAGPGVAEPDDQERSFGDGDGGAGGAGAPSGRAVVLGQDSAVVGGLLGRLHRLAAALVLRLGDGVALAGTLGGLGGLLALDARLGLGLGEPRFPWLRRAR